MRTGEEYILYEQAWKKYGSAMQFIVAMEECSELIKAISKFMRDGKVEDFKSIVEEIADVEIMLEQIDYIFCLGLSIDLIKRQKLERLEQRLKEGSEDEKVNNK